MKIYCKNATFLATNNIEDEINARKREKRRNKSK